MSSPKFSGHDESGIRYQMYEQAKKLFEGAKHPFHYGDPGAELAFFMAIGYKSVQSFCAHINTSRPYVAGLVKNISFPSKNFLIRFALGLGMTLEGLEHLFELYGYCFSPYLHEDVSVKNAYTILVQQNELCLSRLNSLLEGMHVSAIEVKECR